MSPAEARIIREYIRTIDGILDKSGIVVDRSELKKFYNSGIIQAGNLTRKWDEPNGIRFVDGSYLTFVEKLEVLDGEPIRYLYTYRFVSSDQSLVFRYDRDNLYGGKDIIIRSDGTEFWHPLNHLHFQDQEDPRYKTHGTHLAEILDFIRTCIIPL